MTFVLVALPANARRPHATSAVRLGEWLIAPSMTVPALTAMNTLPGELCRLVSVKGPDHQTPLAAQTLTEAPFPNAQAVSLARTAQEGGELAVAALTADSSMVDLCDASIAHVAAIGREVAVSTIGEIFVFQMTAGYAAPQASPAEPGFRAGASPRGIDVVQIRLNPHDWLLLSNQPLESLHAPAAYPDGQDAVSYLRCLVDSGLTREEAAVLVAYEPQVAAQDRYSRKRVPL